MKNLLATAGRVATGLITGAIFAEIAAIGTNAAFDDGEYLVEKAQQKMAPKPQKRFTFKKRK